MHKLLLALALVGPLPLTTGCVPLAAGGACARSSPLPT